MNKKIVIGPEDMKALARYEKTFRDYVDDYEQLGEINEYICFEQKYSLSIDDIKAVLGNIPDDRDDEFIHYYYWPIETFFREDFGFDIDEPYDLLVTDDEDHTGVSEKYLGIVRTEKELLDQLWFEFECFEWKYDDVKHFRKELLDRMELFIKNEGKDILDMEFTEDQLTDILNIVHDTNIKKADEKMLNFFRKIVDLKVRNEDDHAMEIKGYAMYGGNKLYPCDWIQSRDLMIKLYTKTGKALYANTLGYIYYYGRCTGGVPEYDKAFQMFTIGHLKGYYESSYKLADMFHHGYGCEKNDRIAYELYSTVYRRCSNNIQYEIDKLADAALRMGNAYRKGIGVAENLEKAYEYYLQADYASRKRLEYSDFFGDTTVAISLQKTIEKVRAQLSDGFFKDRYETKILDFVANGYFDREGIVSVAKGKGNDVMLKLKTRDGYRVLVTIPEIDYVDLSDVLILKAKGLNVSNKNIFSRGIKYDEFRYNYGRNENTFYYEGKPVLRIKANRFVISRKDERKDKGELLHFVSISFDDSNRTYDYICEVPGIEPGNKVMVSGFEGETEVLVKWVYSRHEGELVIPKEKFKKVIRKV